mmetsp:Transcript_13056/g.20272  ORF Transcript_13056/g.20272 Transcript_13056/m.20272 type:complete len:179 (-) Transcript_13056:761-1297(-)
MKSRQLREVRHKQFLEEQEDLQNPPPISEEDINSGMMSLLNKGIIPRDVDLTPAFEKGAPPVQFKSMRFHDKAEMYAKNDVHTERFNKNAIRFDLQPPPKKLSPIKEQISTHSNALVPVDNQSVLNGQSLTQKALMPPEPLAIEAGDAAGDKDARGYNELMDEYSLHQLIFRKGKLID